MHVFTVFEGKIRKRRTAMIGITSRLAIRAILTGLVMVIITTLAMAQSDDPPPRPAWVNQDHSVDLLKLPDSLPVVGPDGTILSNADGSPVTVDPRSIGQTAETHDGEILSDSEEHDGTGVTIRRMTSPDGTEYLVVTPGRPMP
jgi:hypothetical protein